MKRVQGWNQPEANSFDVSNYIDENSLPVG